MIRNTTLIISFLFANHAGFKTYWLSNQGKGNPKTSVISVIANMAQHKKWNEFIGYDEELLPFLDNALNDNSSNKKLIVLHTYGSHEPACNRFPSTYLKNLFPNKKMITATIALSLILTNLSAKLLKNTR